MKASVFSRQIRFCLSDHLAQQAAEAAEREGETVSAVLRSALREYLASRNRRGDQQHAA